MRTLKVIIGLAFILMAQLVMGATFGNAPIEKKDKSHFGLVVAVTAQNKDVLPSAVVQVEPYGAWGVTNNNGEASMERITFNASAVYQLSVSVLGYKTATMEFRPKVGQMNYLTIELEEESIKMKEVVVVAEHKNVGESTASEIGRQAIDHLQATSLKDLLQLIPGQVSMSNPSLTGSQYFDLRTLKSGTSFGSAVMVDGVPMSTNADMGVGFSSVDGGDKGVDLRSIGTDDVQSVEIIRGIASAEYGDVASGTMIVNSKVGITDLNLRGKIMPGIMQFYAGKGLNVGKIGTLNLSVDYAHGKSDPRYRTDTYDRVIGGVTHSKTFEDGRWMITTKVKFTGVKDWSGADPDAPEGLRKYYRERKDYNVVVSHSGKINLNKLFAGTIKYDFAYTNNTTRIKNHELVGVGGGAIFDANEEGMFVGTPYPTSYETLYGTRSNPVSYYAKISDKFQLNAGRFLNKFNVGFEFRSDVNNGEGVYDEGVLPKYAKSRLRRFKDIPYLNQLTFYAEDMFTLPLSKDPYPNIKGQVGVRWTMIQPGRDEQLSTTSPRINLTFNPTRWLSLRGGFGQTDKMPSLLYLYPELDYYDYYNMSVNNGRDRYYLYSTRIFDLTNPSLRPMRNTKWETGVEFRLNNGMSFSIVGYWEKVKNGFGYDNSLWTAMMFDYWDASDVHFEGQTPIYDPNHPSRQEAVLHNVSRPGNVSWESNRGVEFDINLGKIRATNTSFYINGAYNVSEYHSKNLTYTLPVGESRNYGNVYVVYPEGTGSKSEKCRFSAALRVVQHIPAINFVVSATAQFIFHDYDHRISLAEQPMGYITESRDPQQWADGRGAVQYTPFTEAELQDPNFQFEGFMLKDQVYSNLLSNIPTKWPSVWNLNLRVTKEINQVLGFSFYVNNVLFHQPWQTTNTSIMPVERNSSLFSYGLEMFVHF